MAHNFHNKKTASFLLLTLGAVVAPSAPPQRFKPARFFQLTPDTVSGAGTARRVGNPIAYALERSGPGSILQLTPGSYPSFSMGVRRASDHNARASGRPGSPITIEGTGGVRIVSGKGADTIFISQQVKTGYIVFKNLTIEPGYRAAVMFARGGVHEGFRFWDCNIIGGYDHKNQRGKSSKWGIWGSQLKDFEFKGIFAPAQIRNIRNEHGFYLQNSRGDITIENVQGMYLGRTFCQFTSRPGEGPPGQGNITIRNCKVNDIGLAPGDAHKGGSAFTFGGGQQGTIRVVNCVYRCGFNKGVKGLTDKGVPYGTGALVMVDGHGGPNARLILENDDFRFAPDSGDRPVVSIGGCRDVQIIGRNTFIAGAYGVALELDPVGNAGRPRSMPNGRLRLSAGTKIKGSVEIRGKKAGPKELARLRQGF